MENDGLNEGVGLAGATAVDPKVIQAHRDALTAKMIKPEIIDLFNDFRLKLAEKSGIEAEIYDEAKMIKLVADLPDDAVIENNAKYVDSDAVKASLDRLLDIAEPKPQDAPLPTSNFDNKVDDDLDGYSPDIGISEDLDPDFVEASRLALLQKLTDPQVIDLHIAYQARFEEITGVKGPEHSVVTVAAEIAELPDEVVVYLNEELSDIDAIKASLEQGIQIAEVHLKVQGEPNIGLDTKAPDVEVFSQPEAVSKIQQYLLAAGHDNVGNKHGEPDGLFGPKTSKALSIELSNFQEDIGLDVTGKFDEQTRIALEARIGVLEASGSDAVASIHRDLLEGLSEMQANTLENGNNALDTVYVPEVSPVAVEAIQEKLSPTVLKAPSMA